MTGLAVVLTLSTWFSATAISTELVAELGLTASQRVWLINAVQAGFVIGALCASFFALADVFPMKSLLVVGALSAGLANAALLMNPTPIVAILARLATGVSLALVYPTAMKFIGTWFITGRGLAMGAVVGALTLGSAAPHLIRALGVGIDWRIVIIITTLACVLAAVVFNFLREGPHQFKSARFEFGHVHRVLTNRAAMLANLGYFGHMWELYAFWGWLLAYVTGAKVGGLDISNASLVTFAAIATGTFGCLIGGWMADQFGRCLTSALAMAISGTCALLIGFFYTGPVTVFVLVALVWGFSTIADSAQFSAAVSEVSDPSLVGASLAFQMGVGFAITLLSIWLVQWIASFLGDWQWAFSILSVGPFLGCWAMLKLRRLPEAAQLAGGKR